MTEQHIAMTRKQYAAVKLLGRGLTYDDAAKELGVGRQSVEVRIANCRRQFYCKTDQELFYRLGIAAGRNLPVRFLREDEGAAAGRVGAR